MTFNHTSYVAMAMAKVKYNGKETISVLHCSNYVCGISIYHDINEASNIYFLLTKMIQKET